MNRHLLLLHHLLPVAPVPRRRRTRPLALAALRCSAHGLQVAPVAALLGRGRLFLCTRRVGSSVLDRVCFPSPLALRGTVELAPGAGAAAAPLGSPCFPGRRLVNSLIAPRLPRPPGSAPLLFPLLLLSLRLLLLLSPAPGLLSGPRGCRRVLLALLRRGEAARGGCCGRCFRGHCVDQGASGPGLAPSEGAPRIARRANITRLTRLLHLLLPPCRPSLVCRAPHRP